ncbi:hypothetical protein NA57DRAFT_8678, partial [Rhizodiscina lignyota]
SSVVSIPYEYTYLLPNSYFSNLTEGFVDTVFSDKTSLSGLFESAKNAPFISYDQEFLDIFGHNPQLKLIKEIDTGLPFYEAGLWIYDRNEVWFTSSVQAGGATTVRALKLDTYEVYEPKISSVLINPNGAYYYDGLIYFATYQSVSYPGGITAVNPHTGEAKQVLNNYMGLRFNGPDDIQWIKTKAGKEYMFWTDLDYAALGYPDRPTPDIPDAVWRWDPQAGVLLPIIGRADILNCNGIRINKEMTKLYIGETSNTTQYGGGVAGFASPGLWLYDLDEEARPVNKRLFGFARAGGIDGMHIDDAGRIWTGEGEGIVIRNEAGKVIGLVNSNPLLSPSRKPPVPLANFALAGNKLVILALTRLYVVELAQ